jgi:hypothetical protein
MKRSMVLLPAAAAAGERRTRRSRGTERAKRTVRGTEQLGRSGARDEDVTERRSR